jgi:hypothetical protein
MQIHEYNLHIQHISGADHFLADTICQNPAGLCERDTKEIFRPKDMIGASTNLGTDNSVEKLVTNGIQDIIRIVWQKPENAINNAMVQNGILYSKDNHKYPCWRAVLPTDSVIPVIRYVYKLLGHLDTEMCIAQIASTFHVKGLGQGREFFLDVIPANGL